MRQRHPFVRTFSVSAWTVETLLPGVYGSSPSRLPGPRLVLEVQTQEIQRVQERDWSRPRGSGPSAREPHDAEHDGCAEESDCHVLHV